MFEKLKKDSLKSSLWATVLFFAIGLALVIYFGLGAWYIVTGYVPFVELTPDEIKNQWVAVELTENYGSFAETTEKRENGPETTINVYYVIATGDYYDTDYRFMAIDVPVSYEKEMNKMAEQGGSIVFSGRIRKMDDDIYRYFKEYCTDAGMTEEEFEETTLPYVLKAYDSETAENAGTMIAFSIGVLFLILALWRLVKALSGGYLKALKADLASINVSELSAESDWNSAMEVTKGMRIGRLFTYYMDGTNPRALPNSKMHWAYQLTTTHRTNGIKTGTSYSLMIWAEGYKKNISILVPNEASAQDILNRIGSMFPWVVTGYSDELSTMYHKNRAQFLQLRYNTVDHNSGMTGADLFR